MLFLLLKVSYRGCIHKIYIYMSTVDIQYDNLDISVTNTHSQTGGQKDGPVLNSLHGPRPQDPTEEGS